jgi:hypothetical protein
MTPLDVNCEAPLREILPAYSLHPDMSPVPARRLAHDLATRLQG